MTTVIAFDDFSGVAPAPNGGRLDLEIAAAFPSLSRRSARKLISDGRVVVDGAPVAVASRPIARKSRIAIVPIQRLPGISLNEEWVAIHKPPFVPTQSAPTLPVPSVHERVAAMLKQDGGKSDLFLVHRLDANTSGVIVFARTQSFAAELSAAFASREVVKIYSAVVHGEIREPIKIEAPIARSGPAKFEVQENGAPAVTLVSPLSATGLYSLIEAQILTGRTHQIRVHLAWRGHPVAGDRKYGPPGGSVPARPMLHASRLEHPLLGVLTARLPEDIVEFMNRVGLSQD